MNTKRTFASFCLALSSCALMTAANVSVGDQPGVVRMASGQQEFDPPRPVPPAQGGVGEEDGTAPPMLPSGIQPPPPGSAGGNGFGGTTMNQGMMAGPAGMPVFQQLDYTPYMERSAAVTEAPVMGPRPSDNPLFGPSLMFETNIDNGLGFAEGYHRLNARLPYHVVPGRSVLIGDLSASVTNQQNAVYNFGMVWRNYDALRNRIFGWNVFGDLDDGMNNRQWKRIGFGVESLGKYIDFRANGYLVTGDESVLLQDRLIGDLTLGGNNAFRIRNQTRDNAYSGADFEVGGPLPLLGRRGANMYVGGYWLDSEYGHEALGFSARWEVLATESATVNVNYTNDDTFGVNSWVSLSYTIPNYRERAILQPRNVRDRLADPVHRSNRVHSNLDIVNVQEAVINEKTGRPYFLSYVDPDSTSATGGGTGAGTLEDPWTSMQVAALNNNAGIDLIRVDPRDDDSGTNLTINGGLTLFDCQVLLSSTKDFTLFSESGQDFVIPGVATATGLGPLISDPNMVAGGSVVRLANENSVVGFRIDAANAGGTVFGTGISNPLPITDASIISNTFTRYTDAISLQTVSGNIIVDENVMDGTVAGTGTPGSNNGLVLTTANGSLTNLLIRNNTMNDNRVAGVSVTASTGSTINADDPNGVLGQVTGIVDNTITNSGDATTAGNGIVVEAQAGARVDLLLEGNASGTNTGSGFVGRADGAGSVFNLVSMRDNTFDANQENGALLHYLNGGRFFALSEDINEDLNFNGVLDPGEDLDFDGELDVANGLLNAGEDLNGNGLLDQGIVSNTFSNNTIAGLCIFGEDDSRGLFDIGGSQAALGNSFIGNLGAGLAVDLQNTAVARTNTMNNLFTADSAVAANPSLTFVLDFWEAGQGASTVDVFGNTIVPFDVTAFGFTTAEFDTVTAEVLRTVQNAYYNIPTVGADNRSPIPDGQQLAVDFVIGDIGSLPSNGATEYYTTFIGDTTTANTPLGVAFLSSARDAAGNPGFAAVGDQIASVYSSNINGLGGLTPADLTIEDIHERYEDAPFGEFIHADLASPDRNVALNDALTSGNLTFTANALGGTTAHEIGHTLSLLHMDATGAGAGVTPTGAPPIMGTGAIDLSNQARIGLREFSYTGTNTEAGGATQMHVAQLLSALGTRDAIQPGISGDGISITANDSARLLPSTFINNRIERNNGSGIEVVMNDSARAEGLTIQGNTIQSNSGVGVDLVTNGPSAFIEASNTIGGSGLNTIDGMQYLEGNVITGNQSDGIRALAQNGGHVQGNILSNTITGNVGNGVSLNVSTSGTIDFGTPASNRLISGNTITGNGGAGIQLTSTVAATGTGLINAVVRNNDISNNVSGGIVSQMFGPNSGGATNNLVNLTVGGTSEETNTIAGNGNVGVGFSVAGNGKGVFSLTNSAITGTSDGPDLLTSGDGIFLSRADSSLLQATVENVTSSNNAGNGMLITTQGNDRFDPSQPMSGTINTVDWNRSIFDNNGVNGVAIRTRGDSMLLADGQGNFVRGNAENGIDIETMQNSSFGDSTVGLPPGRRVVFDGFTATGNGVDGLWTTASGGSQLLLEVTSTRVATASGAHAALNTNGDSNYSDNGTDGIHIDSIDNAMVDVKIGAETPVTPTSGRTYIQNNGTNGGAFGGVFISASGNGTGIVNVVNSVITGTQAISTEDTNGNGILDAGEDLNGNDDIDVLGGDGISYNASGQSDLTLIVGGVGEGNLIQDNEDDGVAISAVGAGLDVSRPTIVLIENTIGGENNGVAAGNGGDGVSLNITGGTADVASILADPANIDTDIDDGDGLSFSDGLTESGPIVQLTLTDNLISNNSQRGVNLLLNGAAGERDREDGSSFFDPVRITMTGNTISSNGTEGVYFRGDSDMNQGRLTYLANFPFPDPPFNPADDRPQFAGFYDPMLAQFQADNIGSIGGKTAFGAEAPDGEQGFLNLRTVQNTFLTITGNTIQNNGTGTVTGEGLVLSVGTGSYLAADVRNNTFGGNLEEDVRTESFLSFGNTYDSVDDSGDLTFDAIYHDDSAQLDMRFTGNSGNQIAITSDGATYTNRDALKEIELGFTITNLAGVTDRDAAFFQIDDGGNLDNPNNSFINFGVTQDIDGEFSAGGFNLRGAADPLFPNIEFAPFLP
ncbi:MAG: right-handed parallel beta-helix repeat-containing protein [Fuerstiella sp.]